MPYVEIVHPWPLLVMCGLMLAFCAYCFIGDD